MRATHLTALLDAAPAGVDAALDLVTGFDDVLVTGFGRLDEERAAALVALASATGASPLRDRAGVAAEKVTAGGAGEDHVTVLAGVRVAVLGAIHDALLDRFDTALGRDRAPWSAGPPAPDGGADNLLHGVRAWLYEVALAGWRGVDHDLVTAADPLLRGLLADPGQRRLAVLLDGLVAELRASSPVATATRLPVRRWADLWSRALLLAQPGGRAGRAGEVGTVTGRLLPLGVDVHEHATAVQLQVHAILEPAGGPARLVRTSVAAAKVDTIVGTAVWRLFERHPVLLGALARQRGLDVTDLTVLDGGDLRWNDERAKPGEPADPFATARVGLSAAQAPPAAPLDRHPARIAEPVLVEGYQAASTGDGLTFALGDGAVIAVDAGRLPAGGPLTPDLVAGSVACLGLVRWDAGRWTLQPLAVQTTVKKRTVAVHTADWVLGPTDPKVQKAAAKLGDPLTVLRERAGRLLRK